MTHGLQPLQRALDGIAQRLIHPPSPTEPELLPAASPGAGGEDAANGLSRTARPTADSVAAALTKPGSADAAARTEGLRAELVRAETMLKVAHEAFAAVDIIHNGMEEIARIAVDETLTPDERVTLDAAYQALKQDIQDIVDATIVDGDRILAGGDGPNGAYVITLSATKDSEAPIQILIPSASLLDTLDGIADANLRTPDAARSAADLSEQGAKVFQLFGETVDGQRDLLQDIHTAAFGPQQSLSDFVDSFEPPTYAAHLSHLIADIVSASGDDPFAHASAPLRDIIALVSQGDEPDPIPTRTGTPLTDTIRPEALEARPAPTATNQTSLFRIDQDPRPVVALDETQDKPAAHPATSTLAAVTEKPPFAPLPDDPATDDGAAAKPLGVTTDHTAAASAASAIPTEDTGGTPSALTPPSSNPTAHPITTAVAAKAVLQTIVKGLGELTQSTALHDGLVEDPPSLPVAPLLRPATAGPLGTAQASPIVPMATQSIDAPTPPDSETELPTTDVPMDAALAAFVAAIQVPNPSETPATHRVLAEIRQTEMGKIAELDTARRASGLIQLVREPDTRLETAFAVARTIYEPPSDQASEFGLAVPLEANGFMVELKRADDMLHVADLSIQQMDRHLDYLRGLANEAASPTSRDRGALDSLFQTVKSSLLDTLAQTTEARGERILAGGDGPDGEFIIRLSAGATGGDGHEFAIPSMVLRDLSPGLSQSDIRTPDAALAAREHLSVATADTTDTRTMIGEHRTLLRHLMSLEVAHNNPRPATARSAMHF
jgi:flagellin-like hook-associated protein FlgL